MRFGPTPGSQVKRAGWLFAKNRQSLEAVKGLYLHGGVGSGKTMLMDLFFDTVPVRRKRGVQFNAFMATRTTASSSTV